MTEQIKKISIVIPAFNESANLKNGVLDQVANYLEKQNYPYEVLIVDDGSSDDTVKIAHSQIKNKKNFRIVENPHGGKAMTVISGVLKASGDIILFTDMDQATPISEIENLLPKFNQGYDVVIGSRRGRKGAPLIRKVSAWGFATLRNLILGLPFLDTQCGFKAFSKQAAQEIFPKLYNIWNTNRSQGAAVNAGFDIEMLFIAKKMGFKIAEVPVDWHYVGTERVQIIKDAMEALSDMFRIRQGNFAGKYA